MNEVTVRLVKIVELDPKTGEPIGSPSFGVIAADDYAQAYNDTFNTFEALSKAIAAADGDPLNIVGGDFDVFNHDEEEAL